MGNWKCKYCDSELELKSKYTMGTKQDAPNLKNIKKNMKISKLVRKQKYQTN